MRVEDFAFDLPPDRIALRPAEPRESARLLVVRPDAPELQDAHVADLVGLLRPGDALVCNDTRVVPARLQGHRRRTAGAGAAVEVTLHRRVALDRWLAFARPAKRLSAGDVVRFGDALSAEVACPPEGGEVLLAFDKAGAELDAAIATVGHIPLPPYIAARRPEDERDLSDYQTAYARHDGAVAAPTAGLHLTADLLDRLRLAGVSTHFVTLHVGAGTFLPVTADTVEGHRMHAEWGEVPGTVAEALNRKRSHGGRIVCVGTTSLRLLESAVDADGVIQPFSGETSIFLTPGHRFRTADLLLTNFHLPRSTLLMLVSAFAGTGRMRRAYAHAVATGYRFYSYGDASLLARDDAEPDRPR